MMMPTRGLEAGRLEDLVLAGMALSLAVDCEPTSRKAREYRLARQGDKPAMVSEFAFGGRHERRRSLLHAAHLKVLRNAKELAEPL
jgi:hypothetical protein